MHGQRGARAQSQSLKESSTPLLRMLVNIRLTFNSGNPTLQALFFYNTDESLIQVDNRGTVQGPLPLGDV